MIQFNGFDLLSKKILYLLTWYIQCTVIIMQTLDVLEFVEIVFPYFLLFEDKNYAIQAQEE